MLTHEQIQKVARLQYQVETERYGTFFGARLGPGTSGCYRDSEPPRGESRGYEDAPSRIRRKNPRKLEKSA